MSEVKNEAIQNALRDVEGADDLIKSIKNKDKKQVSNALSRALEDDLSTGNLPSIRMVEWADVQGLLKVLRDEGLLSLPGHEVINLQRIIDVVNVEAFIVSARMAQQVEQENKEISKSLQIQIVLGFHGRQFYYSSLLEGVSTMSEMLIAQMGETEANIETQVDLSRHYKPEVLSLISEYLLNVKANHSLDSNQFGAKNIQRVRI